MTVESFVATVLRVFLKRRGNRGRYLVGGDKRGRESLLDLVLRLFKKACQQGRSERKPEAYSVGYVEGLRGARTMLEGFFNSRQSASGSELPCW